MQIEYEETSTGGRYFVPEAGTQDVAELTWHQNDDGTITADHTYVPHRARGKGIARDLVTRFMDDAGKRGWKIVPACSYVAIQMRRHPEWEAYRA